MPPKAISSKPHTSTARDLVPVGARHLSSKYHGRVRNENGERPTTARALVLRNGKHGAMGTGELMVVAKMTGREKLDLLAEDLVEQSKKAVQSPFRLEDCIHIAEAEYNDYLDGIKLLRDPDFFMVMISNELIARTHRKDIKKLASAHYTASVVAAVIHNAYMFASAWQLIYIALQELKDLGLNDKELRFDLANNGAIRTRYLTLYAYVNKLIEMAHLQLSILASTNPHYSSYVIKNEYAAPDEPDMIFNKAGLREGARSFMDSIIIELLFPNSPYPKHILYSILHDAVAESKKDTKRFSQPLWDAVGKLSELIKLQEILDRPLKGPEGDKLKELPVQMPEEYEQWVDAQLYSSQASQNTTNWEALVFEFKQSKDPKTLNTMWKRINENYIAESQEDIDSLWMLDGEFDRKPSWHAFYIPQSIKVDDELRPRGKKKQLALRNEPESDDSMPELQSVSNSSDEDFEEDDDSEEEEYDDDDEGYDTEEEDELRDLLREAMDYAHEADLFAGSDTPNTFDPAEDRKGNPFLKLLGSLRGRAFVSNPKLQTQETRKEPRKGFYRPRPFSKPSAAAPPKVSEQPKAQTPAATPPQSKKATMEEVEDEDDVHSTTPKKKKKKPKKKKKGTTQADMEEAIANATSLGSTTSVNTPSSPTSPRKSNETPKSPPRVPSVAPYASTASLVEPTTAQSAHSYLAENTPSIKTKHKSRPQHPTIFSSVPEEPQSSSFFHKFRWNKKAKEEEKEKEGVDQKKARKSFFERLSKKSVVLMEKLLHTTKLQGRDSMKWEEFVKLMEEMGFTCDPSTAGSSVRFDPPNPSDHPITFHKPHPDSTLTHVMLKAFGKRLKAHYGWDEKELMRR